MKKLLLLSLVFCLCAIVKAQKVHFIYLQSENGGPFYVRMGDKVMSSSEQGYLILPKLVDSTYSFSLGQPGKREEAQFSISISKADRGFLIKESEGSLSLFDLQTLALYKSIAPSAPSTQTIRRNDRFTALLAKAADDTTLLYHAVMTQPLKPASVNKETVAATETIARETVTTSETATAKQDTTQTSPSQELATDMGIAKSNDTISSTNVANDTTSVADTAVAAVRTPVEQEKQPEQEDSTEAASLQTTSSPNTIAAGPTTDTGVVVQAPAPVESSEATYKRSTVIKKSESSLSSGFSLVFLDSYENEVDTISLTIPNPSFFYTTIEEKPAESKQFLDISSESGSVIKDSSKKETKDAVAEKPKSICTEPANDDDFFKLRRDMAAEKDEDDMIAQAKKYFRNKCFRTEHIKYLSTLFLTDAGKYRFFDTAYFHVYDQDKFGTLQAEIKDSYYANRFKALIAN